MIIIDGNKVASSIREEIKKAIDQLSGRKPGLAVVVAGDHAPSQIYIRRKIKACEEVGIVTKLQQLNADISQEQLLAIVEQFNRDEEIDGILVQLPLPKHIASQAVTAAIDPAKDVDGFHPMNIGKLLLGEKGGFYPCTPFGIIELFNRYHIETQGKHIVIIGRSNIVGKPMAAMLLQNIEGGNATVTVVHNHTPDISYHTKQADILIAAAGKAQLVTRDMVKRGAIVIDVGMNKILDESNARGYRLVGDVDYENVKDICRAITPVPGGVGPMTIAMLLSNTLQSYQMRNNALTLQN